MTRKSRRQQDLFRGAGLTELQKEIFSAVFASLSFRRALDEVARAIRKTAKPTATEKTIEGCFERRLYALLREVNIDFSPEKEVTIQTRRHVKRSRLDSRIGAIVLEYKKPAAFKTDKQREKATQQIAEYVEGVSETCSSPAIGFLTDGKHMRSVRASGGVCLGRTPVEPLTGSSLLRIVRALVSLDLERLSPETLIEDFCGSECSGPIYSAARVFFGILRNSSGPKTRMLRLEWEELFKLGHRDLSQQRRIQERRQALANILRTAIEDAEDEYAGLFALHTSYALVLKLIAYKVVAEIWFGQGDARKLEDYECLLDADSKALRAFCASLEDGGLFRSLGILNLLEGDFFSWYADRGQWSRDIDRSVRAFLHTLAKYVGTTDVVSSLGAVDLFRDLYEATVPQVIRASFGEFYTPYWLAQHVLECSRPGKTLRVLDPCCGSGTFLIAAINRIASDNSGETKADILSKILSNVVGVDLNPLAVLTARVNYFIHIAELLESQPKNLVIPVYLGDVCHPPQPTDVDGVRCLRHSLKTLKEEAPIDVVLPASALADTAEFMNRMYDYESAIRSCSQDRAVSIITGLVPAKERVNAVLRAVRLFTSQLIGLERGGWNGIWARILTNFLVTGSLDPFESIVGNPPWIDWKNLPSGYRERIKQLCIDRGLFSGDRRTGGINLNICALIAFRCAQNWLAPGGRLAFLMPRELAVQQSYQGWRNLMGNGPYFYQEFHDWSRTGHPFDPIKEDFMTYVFSTQKAPGKHKRVFTYAKKGTIRRGPKEWANLREARECMTVGEQVAGEVIPNSTSLTFAVSKQRLRDLSLAAGQCDYVGREGIEFYPQELQLFYYRAETSTPGVILVENYQSPKSKYSIKKRTFALETKYLFPLVKGPFIERFQYLWDGVLVAFPYDVTNPHRPVDAERLYGESRLLLEHYQRHKELIEGQTGYSDKIRGGGEFYGLARTGPYSFARSYVAFRDNTKWRACVVSTADTPWGENKRFVFQNHAASICEASTGRFIGAREAHYVCAILNAPVVEQFIYASSDQRSYKIRPPVYVPTFEPTRPEHAMLADLSVEAHDNPGRRNAVREEIEAIYVRMCKGRQKTRT